MLVGREDYDGCTPSNDRPHPVLRKRDSSREINVARRAVFYLYCYDEAGKLPWQGTA